jgi:hypothetical protein
VSKVKNTLISAMAIGLLAGSTVGVAAQDEAADSMAPAYVTGTVADGGGGSRGTTTSADGFTRIDGYESTNLWEASDPRLNGTAFHTGNWQRYGAAGFQVEAGTRVLENDGGRWVGTTTALARGDLASGEVNTDTMVLHGEDAYDGLTAYVLMDWTSSPTSFAAAVFPGEMPSFPELPAE